MDYLIEFDSHGQLVMTYDYADDLINNVLLSLQVKKGSFFLHPGFGSNLHEITSTRDTDINLAAKYAEDALAWIVALKKAEKIDVNAIRSSKNVIELEITVFKNDSSLMLYNFYHRVI
jgi:phage gp46-like protein